MKPLSKRHLWKKCLGVGLSLAMAVTMLPAMPASAALSESAATTPIPDKACSIPIPTDGSTRTEGQPFPKGAAGSDVFRIPAMITMQNGELLAIADARYTQPMDGNGLDTMVSISSDNGKTWDYGFPFFFPDSYRDAPGITTAFIDPGLLEGPDGTIYVIADAFPTTYSIQNIGSRLGTGYVEIDGKERLALTNDYSKVGTAPVDENDANYLYYVADYKDGYAPILKRADHSQTGYGVDEWYNLYSIDENGEYLDNLKQDQINNPDHKIQQNVYYKDSLFHVYQTGYLWLITSKDHGRTWEHPRDIIPQVKKDDDRALLISPGCGLTTKDGTLVIGLYYHGKGENGNAEKASLMYSKDNGVTWQRTADIPNQENGVSFSSENEIIELEDGTLRMFFRNNTGKVSYADFTKNDKGGYDVGAPVSIDACRVTSTCNVTAITYSKKINGKEAVLVACPEGPGANAGRANGRIFTLLVNEDKTMSLLHKFNVPRSEKDFVYSSLTELPDGSVSLLWEEGDRTALMWYDNFSIEQLAPGAKLEGEAGSSVINVTVKAGETETFINSDQATEVSSKEPHPDVASLKKDQKSSQVIEVPTFAHISDNADLATAFQTQTAAPTNLNLVASEFEFTSSGDKWHIYNEATKQYLTIAPGAESYFDTAAGDVAADPQGNGKFQLHCTYQKDGRDTEGYAVFWNPFSNYNRTSTNVGDGVYDFTLWEREDASSVTKDEPSAVSPLPGYRKADSIENGKKYLITTELNDRIILLYPENGNANQAKLIGDTSGCDPVTVIENTITVTGVGKGFTKASLDGTEYWITVTDDSTRIPTGETIQIPYMAEYDASSVEEEAAEIKELREDTAGMFDHTSDQAGSLDSFSQETNAEITLKDAEVTFTKDASDETKWNIKNKNDKYLAITTQTLFQADPAPISLPQAEGADTFRIHNSGNRHLMFYQQLMNMNVSGYTSGDSQFELTLWKKDATATNSPLPGYRRLVNGDSPEENGVYLITYDFNDSIIVLYSKDNDGWGNDVTKLAYRMEKTLQVTPKKAGTITLTVDGKTYAYKVTDPSCKHTENDTSLYNVAEADCGKEGFTGDTVCNVCGQVIKEGTAIPAKEHQWADAVTLQKLSDAQNGVSLTVCANNAFHQKKTTTYASIYAKCKETFQNAPDGLSEENKSLYLSSAITEWQAAYDAGTALLKQPADKLTNALMTGCIEDFTKAGEEARQTREDLMKTLADALKEAAPIKEAGKQEHYADATWNGFIRAYELASADLSQSSYIRVLTLSQNLTDTISRLALQKNKLSLQTLYNEHKDKERQDYSNRTWAAFQTALQGAKRILDAEAPTNKELQQAESALRDAVNGLKTTAQEKAETEITAPKVRLSAPSEGNYPKAANVILGDESSQHSNMILDRNGEASDLTKKDPDTEISIVNKDGIWGFNGEVKSDKSKYNVFGEDKSLAITCKLWLNTIPSSGTKEILAKGTQYSLQLKDGKLMLWMFYNGGYPTESVALNASEHTNKWLDIVMVINGNGKQRLYVNGSGSAGTSAAGLSSKPEPFTLCYRQGQDGDPFTKDIGYLADVKFYNCEDVSEGLTRDYEAVVNLLDAKTPAANITVSPYDEKTVWSSIGADGSATVMDGTEKFAADTSYQATTTLTAHGDYVFPNSAAFRREVMENLNTGDNTALPTVTVSVDQKTLTIQTAYLVPSQTTPTDPSNPTPPDPSEPTVPTELETALANLRQAIKDAKAIYSAGQGSYTDDTWEAFCDAYNKASNPVGISDAAEIQKLADGLDAARRSLKKDTAPPITGVDPDPKPPVTPVDPPTITIEEAKKEISTALESSKSFYNSGQGSYTKETWDAFVKAYEAASNPAPNLSAEELKNLADNLKSAVSNLKKAPAPMPSLKNGDFVETKGVRYVVINADAKTVTAAYGLNKKKLSKVTILDTVKINDVVCKVTEIKANAFKAFPKLSNVTIGANVTKINKQSFFNCKKLKTLTFKGKKAPSFKAKAFKGTNAKIKVNLPKKMSKKQKNSMKKKLKAAGVSKKATFK